MQITNYIRSRNLRGNASGGVTAVIVSLSLALAFGVAFRTGAIAIIGHDPASLVLADVRALLLPFNSPWRTNG